MLERVTNVKGVMECLKKLVVMYQNYLLYDIYSGFSDYYNLPPPQADNSEPTIIKKIVIGYGSLLGLIPIPPRKPPTPPRKPLTPPPLPGGLPGLFKKLAVATSGNCNPPDCKNCSEFKEELDCNFKVGLKLKKINKTNTSKINEEKKLRVRAEQICNEEGNKDENYKTCCSNSYGCKYCEGIYEGMCKNYGKFGNDDERFKEKYLKYKGKYIKLQN